MTASGAKRPFTWDMISCPFDSSRNATRAAASAASYLNIQVATAPLRQQTSMISMAQCDPHPINAQYISSRGRTPMANVVKKHTISSELAQKMVDQAMAKARQLGVAENVAILDEGGNLKAFGRMDGAPILSI